MKKDVVWSPNLSTLTEELALPGHNGGNRANDSDFHLPKDECCQRVAFVPASCAASRDFTLLDQVGFPFSLDR